MAARYQVRIKGQDGIPRATLTLDRATVRKLDINRELNAPGMMALELDGDNPAWELFELDGQVEVWRQNLSTNPVTNWGIIWEGLHVDWERYYRDGRWTYYSYSVGYLEIAMREVIAWPSTSAQTTHSGAGETVMKCYVEENIGPGATIAAGRMCDGVKPGLSVAADTGAGAAWQGARAYKNLYDVLREIGTTTGVDFDIVGVGNGLYEFRTWYPQRGLDCTLPVVNLAGGGLNAAGNVPVVFSPELGNMRDMSYAVSYLESSNNIIVLGRGEDLLREYTYQASTAAGLSPLNRRTKIENASDQAAGDITALNQRATAALETYQAKEHISFEVIQQPNAAFQQHYDIGYVITAQPFPGLEIDRKVLGVKITVDTEGEVIVPVFGDR